LGGGTRPFWQRIKLGGENRGPFLPTMRKLLGRDFPRKEKKIVLGRVVMTKKTQTNASRVHELVESFGRGATIG